MGPRGYNGRLWNLPSYLIWFIPLAWSLNIFPNTYHELYCRKLVINLKSGSEKNRIVGSCFGKHSKCICCLILKRMWLGLNIIQSQHEWIENIGHGKRASVCFLIMCYIIKTYNIICVMYTLFLDEQNITIMMFIHVFFDMT